MLPPMGHGIAAKGLQAGYICVETELAIAERYLAVQIIPLEIMAHHQGVAVYVPASSISLIWRRFINEPPFLFKAFTSKVCTPRASSI